MLQISIKKMKGSISWDTIKPLLPIIFGVLFIILAVLWVSGGFGEFAKSLGKADFLQNILQAFFGGRS